MLDFEKPLFDIKNKIEALKESQEKNDVDLQEEIEMLEASLQRETEKIYKHLKPVSYTHLTLPTTPYE